MPGKIFHLSIYVTPTWAHADYSKVRKALAHFWVEGLSDQEAASKAIRHLSNLHWKVHALKDGPHSTKPDDLFLGGMGLSHFLRAEKEGISLCLTDWEMEQEETGRKH